MSTIKDAWKALTTLATAVEHYQRQEEEIKSLRQGQRAMEIRLVRLETAFDIVMARSGIPRALNLPPPE